MAPGGAVWHTSSMAHQLHVDRYDHPDVASRKMYDAQRRVLGLTKVGWINLLVLQWLGLRLGAVCDAWSDGDEIVGWSVKVMWPLSSWRRDYQLAGMAWGVLLVLAAVLL